MRPPLEPLQQQDSDSRLSPDWGGGDETGFASIVERYAPLVHARCARALPGADAEDATQAVFWVLARRREQAASSPVLVAWLLRVTENVVRNALRDRGRRRRAEHDAALQQVHASEPAEPIDLEALRAQLDEALAALPRSERQAIELHYLAGFSLAEVASATAAGVSTIKERLQRGIAQLKRHLERRGVSSTALTLGMALSQVPTTPPPGLLPRLQGLRSPSSTPPPSQVRRWARQGPSMTTMLSTVLGATALLTVAATHCSLHGADASIPGHAPVSALASSHSDRDPAGARVRPAAAITPGILASMVPQRTRCWATLRWWDGARTAQRLAILPELALLPDQGRLLVSRIASLHDGICVVDADSLTSREQAIEQHRKVQEYANLAPAARAQRIIDDVNAQVSQGQGTIRGAAAPQFAIPAFTASWHAAAPDAPVMQWLRGMLRAPPVLGCAVIGSDPSWTLKRGDGVLQLMLQGETGTLTCAGIYDPGVTIPTAPPAAAAFRDDDIDCSLDLDGGDGAWYRSWDIQCAVTPVGLHLVSTSINYPNAVATQARCDRSRFDQVPADALLAVDLAMGATGTAVSPTWRAIINAIRIPLQMRITDAVQRERTLRIVDAVSACVQTINGQVVAYVEAAGMLPSITICVDMPQASYLGLLQAVGATSDETGTATWIKGMFSVTCGWQDGHAVITTNPSGLASARGQHGFSQQPEIVHALAALPKGQPQVLVLLRPQAFAQACAPFAGMLSPQLAQQLPAYQQRLAAQSAYAYLTVTPDADASRIEASGLLAGVAAAYLASQLHLPHGNN